MKKEYAQSLAVVVKNVAILFSNPNRVGNGNNETFTVEKIQPLSDDTAVVTYLKSSGKQALAFFYFVKGSVNDWRYFFPTDSHIIGMQSFNIIKIQTELNNYPMNFSEEVSK